MNKKNKKNIKETIIGIAAFLVLLFSFLGTLGIVVNNYGKGAAILYFFLWFWAMNYVCDDRR